MQWNIRITLIIKILNKNLNPIVLFANNINQRVVAFDKFIYIGAVETIDQFPIREKEKSRQ